MHSKYLYLAVEAFAAGVMKAFDLVVCKIFNDDGAWHWLYHCSRKSRFSNSFNYKK